MTADAERSAAGLQRRAYFPAIDSLRALAVAAVVVYHLDKRLAPGGFIGVDVFFVVSGYVVSLTMARYSSLGFGAFVANFYARRILRISPALVACLLVTALASCLLIPQAWLSDANARTGLAAFFGLSNIVLARPDNAYFEPRAELNPFTHTWSLAVEEQFYVVFPLLFWFLVREAMGPRKRLAAHIVLTTLMLGSLVCCAWWTTSRPSFAFYLLPARFWELGFGLCLFVTQGKWLPLVASLSRNAARAIASVCLVLLAASFALLPESPFPFPNALVPVVCTTVLIALVVGRNASPLPGVLTSRPSLWVGEISYSLYLWHWPVLAMFRWTVGLESPVWTVLALLLSVAIAAISYYAVELPLRESRRLRTVPRARLAFGGLAVVTLASGLAGLVFFNETRLSLSVTANEKFWQGDAMKPAAVASSSACSLAVTWQAFEGGGVQTFRPAGCQRPAGTLYVVGDSHGGAYAAMLGQYAAATGREVTLLTKGGCSLFDLGRPPSDAAPNCKRFDAEVLAKLKALLRSGDVLFLPGLRVERFADQWGGTGVPVEPGLRAAALRRGTTEVASILQDFSRQGASILLEAPKPLFKAPPFRCSDWFNSSNPVCRPGFDLARSELELHRRPILEGMRGLVASVARTSIWDPAEILCPEPVCHAFRRGKPLFFDGDHLSAYGNSLLANDFAATVDGLFSGTPRPGQGMTIRPVSTR